MASEQRTGRPDEGFVSIPISRANELRDRVATLEGQLADIWYCPEGHALSRKMHGSVCSACNVIAALEAENARLGDGVVAATNEWQRVVEKRDALQRDLADALRLGLYMVHRIHNSHTFEVQNVTRFECDRWPCKEFRDRFKEGK